MRESVRQRISKAAATRTTMWVASVVMAAGGAVVSVQINKAAGLYVLGVGLYVLGGAMCLTIRHQFATTVSQREIAAAVAAYSVGRVHHDSDQAVAPVIDMNAHR